VEEAEGGAAFVDAAGDQSGVFVAEEAFARRLGVVYQMELDPSEEAGRSLVLWPHPTLDLLFPAHPSLPIPVGVSRQAPELCSPIWTR